MLPPEHIPLAGSSEASLTRRSASSNCCTPRHLQRSTEKKTIRVPVTSVLILIIAALPLRVNG